MTIEPDELRKYLRRVFGYLEGAAVSGMIYLGDRLGLYRALRETGAVTAEDLAHHTGLDRRWVLEWLRSQAAAELVDYRDGRFSLSAVGSFVLADAESSPAYSAGAFAGLPQRLALLEELPETFRTGIGFTFDAHGPEGNEAVAHMFGPWVRHMLVPLVLPALNGVPEKLERGGKVADVGCGAAVALVSLARAFPASAFHGYELSTHALELGMKNVRKAGVDNVHLHRARGEELPTDGDFDLIMTFDCIHDMTQPQEVIRAIRRALREDGTYLIADVKAAPTLEENLERNPMAALMYGFSVLSCLASATSEPGGAGLGTLGFHEELARKMTEEAGFTRFDVHDFEHPVNIFYEVRP